MRLLSVAPVRPPLRPPCGAHQVPTIFAFLPEPLTTPQHYPAVSMGVFPGDHSIGLGYNVKLGRGPTTDPQLTFFLKIVHER